MKKFQSGPLGKTIIVELERGDLLIEGICNALEESGVKNALIVSAVGSIQRLKYHRPIDMGEMANDEFFDIEEPMEVGSLTGSVIDGVGHFHIVAASPNGIYNGHLEPGTEVMYLMEVILAEITECDLERHLTPENVRKLFKK